MAYNNNNSRHKFCCCDNTIDRATVAVLILTVLAMLVSTTPQVSAQQNTAEAIEIAITNFNRVRANNGLSPVDYDPYLTWVAKGQTEAMLLHGIIHEAQPLKYERDILTQPYAPEYGMVNELIGFRYNAPGENVYAHLADFWRPSPSHWASVLHPRINVIGFWVIPENNYHYITVYVGRIE